MACAWAVAKGFFQPQLCELPFETAFACSKCGQDQFSHSFDWRESRTADKRPTVCRWASGGKTGSMSV
jgi:hypothetical protein